MPAAAAVKVPCTVAWHLVKFHLWSIAFSLFFFFSFDEKSCLGHIALFRSSVLCKRNETHLSPFTFHFTFNLLACTLAFFISCQLAIHKQQVYPISEQPINAAA